MTPSDCVTGFQASSATSGACAFPPGRGLRQESGALGDPAYRRSNAASTRAMQRRSGNLLVSDTPSGKKSGMRFHRFLCALGKLLLSTTATILILPSGVRQKKHGSCGSRRFMRIRLFSVMRAISSRFRPRAAWRDGSPVTSVTKCFRASRRTESGSHSPASMMAIRRFTAFPLKEASPNA